MNTPLRKAAEMALKVLENPWKAKPDGVADSIIALRQALAQPEQEPYGYFRYDMSLDAWVQNREDTKGIAFYTAPLKKEWVGLTDEEVGTLTVFDGLHHVETPLLADFARAVEAKLKEKNT